MSAHGFTGRVRISGDAPLPLGALLQERQDCYKRAGSQLSAEQAAMLAASRKVWEGLNTAQQASFLNITAALSDAGLSLAGLRITSIAASRIHFAYDTAFEDAVAAAASKGTFQKDPFMRLNRDHPGYNEVGYRQNVSTASLQIGIGPRGVDIDIDYYNPLYDAASFFGHLGEVISNRVTHGTTSPFIVARKLRGRGVSLGHDCE